MSFNAAQYDATISAIESGKNKLVADYNAKIAQIKTDPGLIPQKYIDQADEVFNKVVEELTGLLESANLPPILWAWHDSWANTATAVSRGSQEMYRTLEKSREDWGGSAAEAFMAAAKKQPMAMDALQTQVENMSAACRDLAEDGFLFYAAIGAAIQELGAAAASLAISAAAPPALLAFIAALEAFVTTAGIATATFVFGIKNQKEAFHNIVQAHPHPLETGDWPKSPA